MQNAAVTWFAVTAEAASKRSVPSGLVVRPSKGPRRSNRSARPEWGCSRVRLQQKLHRNGSSTVLTIARPILAVTEWLPGQIVIVEVLEDKSLRVRLPCERDFQPMRPARVVLDADEPPRPLKLL